MITHYVVHILFYLLAGLFFLLPLLIVELFKGDEVIKGTVAYKEDEDYIDMQLMGIIPGEVIDNGEDTL